MDEEFRAARDRYTGPPRPHHHVRIQQLHAEEDRNFEEDKRFFEEAMRNAPQEGARRVASVGRALTHSDGYSHSPVFLPAARQDLGKRRGIFASAP